MKKLYLLFPVLLSIHAILLSITQFTAWPEMLAYPYLMNKGFQFYGDIIHPYLPLLPHMLFYFFSFFGFTVLSLQLITGFFVLISDVFFFFIAKKLFSLKQSLMLLFIYISFQVFLEGNGLWFDHAVVPFVLSAFYFFLRFKNTKHMLNIFFAGFLLGIAFLIKQTAVWYVLVVPLLLAVPGVRKEKVVQRVRSVGVFSFAVLLPFLSIFLFFEAKNIIFWGILFPFTIMPKTPGYILYPTMKQVVATVFIFSPMILLILKRNTKARLLLLWFFASLGFLMPRFAYFHLQPALPFFALALGSISMYFKKHKLFLPIAGIYGLGITLLLVRFFVNSISKPSRFFEPQVLQEVSMLNQLLPEDEPVFFYNTPANYMVAGGFVPIKPWADTFPWYLELSGLQEEIVRNLESEQVEWVVLSQLGNAGEYALGSYRPAVINAYVEDSYTTESTVSAKIFVLEKID